LSDILGPMKPLLIIAPLIIIGGLFYLQSTSILSQSVMIQDIPKFSDNFPEAYSTIATARFKGEEARNLHYVTTGNPDGQLIVFIHGAPGDWRTFEQYLEDPELLEQFRMISVDRPGYGLSDLGNVERSLEQQAKLISLVLGENQSIHDPILVGHSFGGAVAVRLLMDYPKAFAQGIILSGSLSPYADEKPWWEHVAHYPPAKWLLPKDIYVMSEEVYTLKDELETILPLWEKITTPTIIIHGTNDIFVPLKNAHFMHENLINSENTLDIIENQDHSLPKDQYTRIKAHVLRVAEHFDHDEDHLPAFKPHSH